MAWNISGQALISAVQKEREGCELPACVAWCKSDEAVTGLRECHWISSSQFTFRNFRTLDFLHHVIFMTALNLFL